MAADLCSLASSLRSALSGFEPGSLSGEDCARLAEELARTEKACAAARLLASRRAVSAGAHAGRGFSDGACWVAHQSGSTAGDARRVLELARLLDACPDTREALVDGQLSLAQAGEIARAESEAPGGEAELLELARSSDLSKLREKARDRRVRAIPAEELHRRQVAARSFRHWIDQMGMVSFKGALPPEVGLPVVSRIEQAASAARRAIRKEGGRAERFEAHAADALVAMLEGSEVGRQKARAEVVIVCDLNALRRGHAHAGEPCHIVGGGPIPASLVAEISHDAFLKAVLHDGVAIHTVAHFGRHLPAELRSALELGPVPEFSGAECVDCGRRYGLEWDHLDPVANGGVTSYDNLRARCWPDHQAKTERDRQAGRLGAWQGEGAAASALAARRAVAGLHACWQLTDGVVEHRDVVGGSCRTTPGNGPGAAWRG